MITPTQQDILRKLATLSDLSPDIRFGQLLANLGFLAEDACGRTLWDVEDEELLRVMEQHETDLSQRPSNVA